MSVSVGGVALFVVVGPMIVLTWALCRMAGLSDRLAERIEREPKDPDVDALVDQALEDCEEVLGPDGNARTRAPWIR